MQEELTRRGFLKGAAAVTAATLAGGALVGCMEAAEGAQTAGGTSTVDEITWDHETDVVIAGMGASGSFAAYETAVNGADVLVVEVAPLPGGSMGRCGGAMQGADTKFQKEAGITTDSITLFKEWVTKSAQDTCPQDIIDVFCENAGKDIEWYNDVANEYKGADIFMGKISYGQMKNGLMNQGETYDLVGWYEDEDKRPIRSHWAVCDSDDANSSGADLYDPILQAINAQSNITVLYETRMTRILKNADGECIGIVAEQGGKDINIKAKKAVFLGTGGFEQGHDVKYRMYGPKLADREANRSPFCVGDGLMAGIDIGADITGMYRYAGYPENYNMARVEGVFSYGYEGRYNPEFNDTIFSWNNVNGDKSWYHSSREAAAAGGTQAYLESLPVGTELVPIQGGSHGGLVINTKSEVLDVWGDPIPRLYASGCVTGTNVFGPQGAYPGCGTYVTFACVFARIAGQNMAALESWA